MGTIDTFAVQASGGTGAAGRSTAGILWSGLVRRLGDAVARWRQRRDLRELSDDQLRDIGVTRQDARREAARPFWD